MSGKDNSPAMDAALFDCPSDTPVARGRSGKSRGGGSALVIAANTSWNLVNFRGNLIGALRQRGFRVIAVAPRDDHSDRLENMVDEYHALDFRSAAISPVQDVQLFMRYVRLLRLIRPAF